MTCNSSKLAATTWCACTVATVNVLPARTHACKSQAPAAGSTFTAATEHPHRLLATGSNAAATHAGKPQTHTAGVLYMRTERLTDRHD